MPSVYPGDDGSPVLTGPGASDPVQQVQTQNKHTGSAGPPPRDPFTAYERGNVNTAHDQVLALVEQFQQIMGWPAGVDEVSLELQLLQNGLYLSPEQAYNWLFKQLSPELQKANPNAEFGMTYDAYLTTVNAFRDAFYTLTGTSDVPPDILRMAVDQQWTQAELTQFLTNDKRYSSSNALPWLQVGMTYKDARNQFASVYGKAPTGVSLASWFAFHTAAQTVGQGQVASIQPSAGPARQQQSQSEIR